MEKPRFRSRPENIKSFFAVLCGWGTVLISGFLLFLLSQGVLGVALAHRWILFVGLIAALVMAAAQLLLRPKTSPADAETAAAGETLSGRLSAKPLDYLVSLINVSRAVSNNVPFADLGQVIVDSCRDSFDCDEVSLMMLEPDGDQLAVTAFAGHRENHRIRNARVRMGEGVAGTVAQTRSPLILGAEIDTKRFPGFETKGRQITSAMVAPIVVKDRVIGVLNASSSNPETSYTEDELRVLCILAEHAGIVASKTLENSRVSRLIGKMRRRNHQLAQRLAKSRADSTSETDTDHRAAA